MSLLFNFPQTAVIDVIRIGKIAMIKNKIPPPYCIRLSQSAHKTLIEELRQAHGRKYMEITEIEGMKVEIDPLCPPQGAYIIGGGSR